MRLWKWVAITLVLLGVSRFVSPTWRPWMIWAYAIIGLSWIIYGFMKGLPKAWKEGKERELR
jgi:hypothetical protein